MDTTGEGPPADELDQLRAERDEWRRRAELAEAVAAERLARAETAERALGQVPPTATAATAASPKHAGPGPEEQVKPPRPRSLLERWRRYTDTIN